MKPRVRVLIVEDEAVVAMDIRSQLERLGYEVVGTASTAGQGIERAGSSSPDLILMDVQLAGVRDGIEAAGLIRDQLKTPVVFLTAFADSATLAKAKEVSPYGYIVKPFDERDLQTALEIALSRSEAEKSLEKSNAELTAILDSQRQGAIVVDARGRVSFASRVAERMIGVSKDELVGVPWKEAMPMDDALLARVGKLEAGSFGSRPKVPVELRHEGQPFSLELEMVQDPRNEAGFILFLYDVSEVRQLRDLLDEEAVFERIIGSGKAMQAVFQLIREVGNVDSPVLIQGETGTGKELVARAIHQRSHRHQGPFVPVNCGALTQELSASQLFGHRKGSFTGAITDHKGFFAAADHGSLFMDEIGELPTAVQPALLRALDDRGIAPVGETEPREIDFRLIAATSRPLEDESRRDEFRSDLYYRLSVVRIVMPPLRDRLEDIPILSRAFLADARAKTGKEIYEISSEAMSVLLRYRWPGNVRQLKNALEFAVIRAQGPILTPDNLPSELDPAEVPIPEISSDVGRIRAALDQTGGNRREAAKLLGISRSTLYRRLERLDLDD